LYYFRCNPEIIDMLIEKGIQLDSQNLSGWTALHYAVFQQQPECMRKLIHHGCDVNIQVRTTTSSVLKMYLKFLSNHEMNLNWTRHCTIL